MQVGNHKRRFSINSQQNWSKSVNLEGTGRERERKQPWLRVEQGHFLEVLLTLVSMQLLLVYVKLTSKKVLESILKLGLGEVAIVSR